MGRQFRSARQKGVSNSGDFREFVGPTPASSVASANQTHAHIIPSYGVTDVSTWAASTYYIAPPTQGCIKTLFSHSTAGVARWFNLSATTTTGVVTVNAAGGATTSNTHLALGASTLDNCITLMGINSTHWVVVSVYPTTASTAWDIRTT
jgi:hypothetical protein